MRRRSRAVDQSHSNGQLVAARGHRGRQRQLAAHVLGGQRSERPVQCGQRIIVEADAYGVVGDVVGTEVLNAKAVVEIVATLFQRTVDGDGADDDVFLWEAGSVVYHALYAEVAQSRGIDVAPLAVSLDVGVVGLA